MKFNNLIDKVWDTDAEQQKEYLELIARDVRKSPDLVKIFIENKMIFVPENDDYLPNITGEWITDPVFDIYNRNGECKEYAKLWIPLYDFDDNIISFAFYDGGWMDRGSSQLIKYRMQRMDIPWNKYMNIRRHTMKKALEEQVIFINDGFMDKFQLDLIGVPSASLYGSNISTHRELYLRSIKNVVLCRDNDNAGVLLEEKFLKLFPNGIVLEQSVGKDMDDYLKDSPNNADHLLEFYNEVKGGRFKFPKYSLPSS